jgi:YidC/Oxa1 family membrane protein insertase
MGDQKNMFLAIVLSVGVMIVWYFLVMLPAEQEQAAQQLRARQQQIARDAAQLQQRQPGTAARRGAAPAVKAPVPVRSLDAVLADPAAKRVAIFTPSLKGSISLTGARIDYLELRKIREAANPASPDVVMFSPPGTAAPYYVQYGWRADTREDLGLPDENTVWDSQDTKLTPQSPVTLTYDNGKGLIFRQKIEADENYLFTVTQSVENKSGLPVALMPHAVVVRQNKPKVEGIYQFEGLVGFLGAQKKQEITYDKAIETQQKGEAVKVFKETAGWIGFTDRYWAAILVPDQTVRYSAALARTAANGQMAFEAYYTAASVDIAIGAQAGAKGYLFAGAKKGGLIDEYQQKLNIERFDLLIDWGWLSFTKLPQGMFYLIDLLYKWVGNFGVAIILITVLIKLIFYPLNHRSFASMSKMKLLQPEMTKLKERYPDDKARQQQEMMALYKREKVNPLSGCIPVLLQIPVFLALYNVLNVSFEMRHAAFFGWVHDLSAPDPTWMFNLFGLLPFDAPSFVPQFLLIGVWPFLMGITMFLQMRLSPMPPDPIQQQVLTWMPLVFTAMLASAPAGLVIYWTWNNLLSIIQQSVIMSRHGTKIELFDNLGITKLLGKDASAPVPRAPQPQNDNKPRPNKPKPRRKGA